MKLNNIQGFEDKKRGGTLYPFELVNVPFIPRRIFWVINAFNKFARGGHAHRFCQQFYICVKGKIDITLIDGYTGHRTNEVMKEGDTLFIDKLLWTRERFITGDEILLVLCSHPYDKNDYIYDVNELKRFVSNG